MVRTLMLREHRFVSLRPRLDVCPWARLFVPISPVDLAGNGY